MSHQSPLGSSPARATPSRTKSAATVLVKAPIKATKFALSHPKLMKKLVFPLVLTNFSTPLIAALPLGSLGPVLAMVAVACGRFQLRREMVGGGYALMRAVGMAGIEGQALGLLGMVGLEACGMYNDLACPTPSSPIHSVGPDARRVDMITDRGNMSRYECGAYNSRYLADSHVLGTNLLRSSLLTTMLEPNIRPHAQIIGLAISALSTATGTLGSLGALLGARSMSLLFNELRAFATFQGLRWAAGNLQGLWESFRGAGVAVKAAFLQYVLRNPYKWGFGNVLEKPKGEERVTWAKAYLKKVARKLQLFPVEAMSPELAVMMKAWDQEKNVPSMDMDSMKEWVKIECEAGDIWSSIVYEADESVESWTEDGAGGETNLEDRSHHRSLKENARSLEQVARETLAKSGMSEEEISATVANMGLDWNPAEDGELAMEELDHEDAGDDEDDIEISDLEDPLGPNALR